MAVSFNVSTYWTSGVALLREFSLDAELVNLSPLRIGSGREPPLGSIVDLAVIRIRREGRLEAYIPGSSFKGLFRSQCETLVRMKNPRVEPCSGLTKNTCMDIRKTAEGVTLHTAVQTKLRTRNSKEAMELFFHNACLLCKVFGAPSYAGRISFSDAYLLSDAHYGVRTGIAIDRRTGAVFGGSLYQVEYVEPGARFSFSLRFRNLPNYAVGMLARTITILNNGELRVGGFKTRGFGQVKLESLTLRYMDYVGAGKVLDPLEPDTDKPVDLSNIVSQDNGYYTASKEEAWKALKKFEEVWDSVNLS